MAMRQFGVAYLGRNYYEAMRLSLIFDYIVLPLDEARVKWDLETTRHLVKTIKSNGTRVYLDPWGVAGIFGGEAFSNWLLHHPEAWQRTTHARRVPHACLDSSATRTFIEEWTRVAADLRPDGILWDEPHVWISQWGGSVGERSCCDDTSVSKFINFLADITEKQGLEKRLVVTPENSRFINDRFDSNGIDPYWIEKPEGIEYFDQYAQMSAKHVQHVWIQAYKIPRGREDELKEAVRLACLWGHRDIAFWAHPVESPSALASYNPREIAAVMAAATKKYKY